MDGQLDEEVYAREKPFGGLIQVAPRYGEAQTERSDVWITYDDQNMYVACRCWDSAPPDEWIANELRRDTNGLRQNDHIGVMFDTFYDRRSGFVFYTNPLGARADYSVVDEGGSNTDWNPVWTSKTGRFDGGWTVEMAIPFKSIPLPRRARIRSGASSCGAPCAARTSGRTSRRCRRVSPGRRRSTASRPAARWSASTCPEAGKNIELKPYAMSRV